MLNSTTYRQLRGLLVHFRAAWPRIRQDPTFRRGLFGTFKAYAGTAGKCRWCHLPTLRKLRWHDDCVDAYRAATGQSLHSIWGTAKAPPCQCGQPANELDHQDALILAWTSGDPRRLVRAYSLNNLTWLCTQCHAKKTRRDLAHLKYMRDQHVCLAGLIPAPPTHHSLVRTDWVLAEHGRVNAPAVEQGRLKANNPLMGRRIPITFDPKLTTCPRCLVAMERPDPSPPHRPPMPPGWHLDERPYIAQLVPSRKPPAATQGQQMELSLPA